jgi:hypothetical protein
LPSLSTLSLPPTCVAAPDDDALPPSLAAATFFAAWSDVAADQTSSSSKAGPSLVASVETTCKRIRCVVTGWT